MIDKLEKLDLNLLKLEELDKKKFSPNNFKETNQQLESIVSELIIAINSDIKKKFETDEQAFFEKILFKIEKIESKILPKANLLNSFSKSII